MKTALIIIDLIEDYFDAGIWADSRIPANRTRLVERTNDLVAICRRQEARLGEASPEQARPDGLPRRSSPERSSGKPRRDVGGGVPIIWVRQEFEPGLSNVFPHMRESGRVYAVRGTPGSRLLRDLDVEPSDLVLTKHRYSAFFETSLAEVLAARQIDTVILAGVTTAWCIRSTAVDAYQSDLTHPRERVP